MQALLQLTQALADETRLRLLMTLQDGQATVSDLAARLGVPQPRISSHLALLRRAGLVTVDSVGRQRTYSVDADRLRALFAALYVWLPASSSSSPTSRQAAREVRRNSMLRQGRTCYDHLAGVAGVQLLDELLRRGWVEEQAGPRPCYRLTPKGRQALQRRNVDLPGAQKARRQFAYSCLDWTERRPHLGGALGAAILQALSRAGYIRRDRRSRAVTLLKPVTGWLTAASSATSS
jgi:DNA-binding transcriptional ArsR family regulator